MPSVLKLINEDIHFRMLTLLETRPNASQERLAWSLGVSVASVYIILRILVEHEQVEIRKYKTVELKYKYTYQLTPRGVMRRVSLAHSFLHRRLQEYEALQIEIAAVRKLLSLQMDREGLESGQ